MKDRTSRRTRWLLAPAVAALLILDGCAVRTPSITPTAAPAVVPTEARIPTPTTMIGSVRSVASVTASPSTSQMTSSPPAAAPSVGTNAEYTVAVRLDPKLGRILVDGKGRTLYRHSKDGPNASACAGRCAQNWPPLIVTAPPKLDDNVPGKLTVITRGDGSKQVTYNGIPLYYFVRDSKPGDTTGQGVGGTWFVVTPGSVAEDDDDSSR